MTDELGRLCLFSNSLSASALKLTCDISPQSFDFEHDDFILDDLYRPISTSRQRFFDDLHRPYAFNLSITSVFTDYSDTKEKMSQFTAISEDGVTAETRSKKSPTRTTRSQLQLSQSWLTSILFPKHIYIPQIYDRVVLSKTGFDCFLNIRPDMMKFCKFEPCAEITQGVILNTEVIKNDRGEDALSLTIATVPELDSLPVDEIPVCRNSVCVSWLPQLSVYYGLMLHSQYEINASANYHRGDSLFYVDNEGKLQGAIFLGETRDSTGVKIKIVDTSSILAVRLYNCFKELNFMASSESLQKMNMLSKRLRQQLKASLFQKSVNYLDYLIETNEDVNFPFRLTFDTILKKLESGYYRRMESIFQELDIYANNSRLIESIDFDSDFRKAIAKIKQIIKTALSSRTTR